MPPGRPKKQPNGEPTGKPPATRRPPRLHVDKRRKKSLARILEAPPDTGAEDVAVPEPLPPFEGVTFGLLSEDENGRPRVGKQRKPIDLVLLTKLAMIGGITDGEMADMCGVSATIFSRRKGEDPAFRAAITQGRAMAKVTIRRWQWKHMEQGNFEAARWLGIQHNGERRNPETLPTQPESSGKSALLERLEAMERIEGRVVSEPEVPALPPAKTDEPDDEGEK